MTSLAPHPVGLWAEERVCVFPCTAGQRAFWLLDQLEPGNTAGNIPLRFRLTGPLNPAVLEQAFLQLILRHEALRTAIRSIDGEPHQVIADTAPFTLRVEDLRGGETSQQEAVAGRNAITEAHRPFDLSRSPLIRAVLLLLGEHRHILLITLHHIISDGWSSGIVLRELVRIYGALLDNTALELAPLSLQFADYAEWEHGMDRSGAFREDLAFWRPKLANPPAFNLPSGGTRFQADIVSKLIPRDISDALAAWSHGAGHTLFVTYLACFQIVLRNWLGQGEMMISTLVANRRSVEVEPVIGLFVNSLLLRTDLGGSPTLEQAVQKVSETVIEAIEHQSIPFDLLIQRLGVRRTRHLRSYAPVNFIYQAAFLKPCRHGELEFDPIPSVTAGAIYALNCFCVERQSEGWRVSVEYNSSLFTKQTIETLLSAFLAGLDELRRNPSATLPVLADAASDSASAGGSDAAGPEDFLGPTSDCELALASIWEDILDQRQIDVRTSFFDLGGHSLQAARIVARANKIFGVDLRLARLFQAPTIAGMAALIEEERQPPQEVSRMGTVIPVRTGGAKPCLFVIHGAGGHVLGFEPLVRRLTAGIPVYGVESAGIDLTVDPHQTVDAIAEQHLADIVAVDPTGPYRLLGYSFGGVVAYELARRLRETGKRVSLLGMVDTLQPSYHPRTYDTVIHPERLPRHVRTLFNSPDPVAYAVTAIRSFLGRLQPWSYRFRRAAGFGIPRTLEALVWQNVEAASRYTPQPCPGRITLFRAAGASRDAAWDEFLGWGGLAAGGVSVIDVPGTHFDMLSEPNVIEFARLLSECLDKDDD